MPDVIVLDVRMSEGVVVTRPSSHKVLAISFANDEEAKELADDIGAARLLDKMELSKTLVPAILELAPLRPVRARGRRLSQAGAEHRPVLATSKHLPPLKPNQRRWLRPANQICRSVSVNSMTGVSGISFFRTAAASAPFNRGMTRSRSIKSGRNAFAFSI